MSQSENAGRIARAPQAAAGGLPGRLPDTRALLLRVVLAGLVIGTLYRLLPIALGQPMLSRFFMTEDGYLLLTVARNMAIGLGMSVSEGTIPTNGVQPLITFLFTLPYLATGGDKVTSLVGVHLILAAIALAGAFTVRAFGARVLRERDADPVWPWLAAGLWFLGPLLLPHTMNALETGLSTLMILVVLLMFQRVLTREGAGEPVALGALCGVAFLARNDNAFLVIAVFGTWLAHDLVVRRQPFGEVIRRLVPPGIVVLAIVAPWLIHNQVRFGSIMPISGAAQSLSASFGDNLHLVPVKLFEHMFSMLPVPGSLEGSGAAAILSAILVIGVLGYALIGIWRRGGPVRFAVVAYLLHGLALVAYYGLFFGAPYFLSRYFAPLAPLLIVAVLYLLLDLARRLFATRAGAVMAALGLASLALTAGQLVRSAIVHEHGHFQVVDWVEANVPETAWVGAVQSGTLGYWHDRTINLDGKVNPEALEVLRQEGHVLRYVVESEIDYMADWSAMAGWVARTEGGFDRAFEVIVEDPVANLGVLRRRGAP